MTSAASLSVLGRSSFLQNPGSSAVQSQVDGLVSHFVEEAASPTTLAAMMAGGMAYRVGRLGIMSLGTSAAIRPLSVLGGLATEVSAFELTSRTLQTLQTTVTGSQSANLWHWGGQGGWAQGLTTSAITFGMLKSAGFLAREQNLVFQHALQSTAMVAGHNTAGILGIADRPQGSLAEQLLHAEATNLQLGAGMGLAGHLMPGVSALERGLDLSLSSREVAMTQVSSLPHPLSPSLSYATAGEGGRASPSTEDLPSSFITMMSMEGGDQKGGPTSSSLPKEIPGRLVPPPVPVSENEGGESHSLELPFPAEEVRYFLPSDPYYQKMSDQGRVGLEVVAGAASAVERGRQVSSNIRTILQTPMKPRTEYSPDGAAPVLEMRVDLSRAEELAGSDQDVGVFTPGTAILGVGEAQIVDGRQMARIAGPIMTGKAKFFIRAGVNASRLCIECELTPYQRRRLKSLPAPQAARQMRIWLAQDFLRKAKSVANNYRFINVEDAQGVDLPIILEGLRDIGVPVWSDDKQGTGVAAATTKLSWLALTSRDPSQARGIIYGAGAGGWGVYDELMIHGFRPENVMVTDSGPNKDRSGTPYPLYEGRPDLNSDYEFKKNMARGILPGVSVEEFAQGASFMVNLGVVETFTRDLDWTRRLFQSMHEDSLILALTNPDPGIYPEMLRDWMPSAFWGSGNLRWPNNVNNSTVFGPMGAAVLASRARRVGPNMTRNFARGMHEMAREDWQGMDPEQRRWRLIPRFDDPRLLRYAALAAAKAAARDGVTPLVGPNPSAEELEAYDRKMEEAIAFREVYRDESARLTRENGPRFYQSKFPTRYAPFSLREGEDNVIEVAPQIQKNHFEFFAARLGLAPESVFSALTENGELRPRALVEALQILRPAAAKGSIPESDLRYQELKTIVEIAAVSPSLGLALALLAAQRMPDASRAGEPGHYVADGFIQVGPIERLELGPRKIVSQVASSTDRSTLFHRPLVLNTILRLIPEARKELGERFPDLALP